MKLKTMFKSRTIQILTATGVILSTIWGIGDTLGIPSDFLAYMEKAITLLGLVLGIKFRTDAEKKAHLNRR